MDALVTADEGLGISEHAIAELLVDDDSDAEYEAIEREGSLENDIFKQPPPVEKEHVYGKDVSRIISVNEIENVTLTWENLNVYVTTRAGGKSLFRKSKNGVNGKTKQILQNVTGYAKAGTLLAIMGASGAGKSTLLNCLTYRNIDKLTIDGNIKVNGQAAGPGIRSLSAYVQQNDVFIGTLKVGEHLRFQAMLRMDKEFTYKQRMQRVDESLTELGLKKCENTLIGVPGRLKGISGGEKKRLAFASEVLTNPKLMFCDEPTSGLDSFMAQNVVTVLKSLANHGKTILCTIHQPSSEVYAMFDRVLLMAEGRTAYLGPKQQVHSFFGSLNYRCPQNFNPADFYIHTLAVVPSREQECKLTVKKISDAFETSSHHAAIKDTIATENANPSIIDFGETLAHKSPYKASWLSQFSTLLQRSFVSIMREPLVVKVRTFQTVFVALLLGLVYLQQDLDQEGIQNITGVLFLFCTNMTFQNLFAVINVFCEESLVFMREHFNGCYRVDTYYLSKMIAEVPFFIFIPMLFTLILYWMIGLYSSASAFFTCMALVVLVTNVATSFGYMVSCLSGNVEIVITIVGPLILPLMVMGGFYINVMSIPVYFIWLQYLSWFKYANEALNINQWINIDSIECGTNNRSCIRTGEEVLDQFNFKKDNMGFDIGLLFVLIFGYRLIGYLLLLLRTRKSN